LDWDQLDHAENWILFPENMGEYISIDETSLSQGELYTVLTNKSAKGQKGAIVAMVKGVESENVISILKKIPKNKRDKVKEVTLDMAATMEKIVKKSFPKAKLVTDRFHVQKLAYEALQDLRISHRWKAIDHENLEMDLAKEQGKTFIPNILENGDTLRQLLVRSRYLLFKHENKWTPTQRQRAEVLFHYYPDLKKAYNLCRELGGIYEGVKDKRVALTKLAQWYNKVEHSGFKTFNTVRNSLQHHYQSILNYFENRSTNASAEAFNAKIKTFRSQFRGVRNIPFFLFRLSNIYA
jgi:transposase